jgi:alpha-L-fucosidase 2
MTTNRRTFLQGGLALATLQHLMPSLLPQSIRGSEDELWYARPAERWLEALPIGNGRLGGMVFGGAKLERIALSESTAWSGVPATSEVNPGALSHLQEIR